MATARALTLLDIPWLRQSSLKAGASGAPSEIATRLVRGGLVSIDFKTDALIITKRGELALTRLG
jgi:hypothetical protein